MIRLRQVALRVGELSLGPLDLACEQGEYFVLLGPTGAGKTVLLEAIAGLRPFEHGSVEIAGEDVTLAAPEHRGVGMVYQDYLLFPHISVADNIAFGLGPERFVGLLRGGRRRLRQNAAVTDVASTLGLEALLDRKPGTLSGGEQQRVALARALVKRPRILLLDEPLSAVDPQTREELQDALREIHASTGATVVHVTHRFEEATVLADRCAVLGHGRLQQLGTPEELLRRPANAFVARFLGGRNVFEGVAEPHAHGSMITAAAGLRVLTAAAASGEVSVSIRPEDVQLSISPTSSADNTWQGRVTEITDLGAVTLVCVAMPSPLYALVTRRQRDELDLHLGGAVSVQVSPGDAHVF